MRRQSCFLLFIFIAGILSQSCDYVKNISVKYQRYWGTYEGKVFLSECINDTSMKARLIHHITGILIECQSSNLPELKPSFVNNMTYLQYITIKACNINIIQPGAFTNLPSLRRIVIENNNISHIPRGIFENLPKLSSIYLNSNNITTIADEAFANLPALGYIDLNNNNIKHMFRNWFTNTSTITHFSISRNQIGEVPPKMFKGLTKASWFDLSQNFISVIHKEAFVNVSQKIFQLDLHHNYLKEVDMDSFPLDSLILELRLDFNLLNYIPENLLRNVHCRHIAIVGNPFKCSCLSRTHEVLTETWTSAECEGFCNPKCNIVALPVCASLPTATEHCIESVDQEVTDKITSYVKEKLGFSSLHHWARHCESVISSSNI